MTHIIFLHYLSVNMYNNVSYDASEMNAVKHSLDSMISSQCASGLCTDSEHCITVAQVCGKTLVGKSTKHNGQIGHYSDHIIIVLSSVIGKLLDRVILSKHYGKFAICNYQYSFF